MNDRPDVLDALQRFSEAAVALAARVVALEALVGRIVSADLVNTKARLESLEAVPKPPPTRVELVQIHRIEPAPAPKSVTIERDSMGRPTGATIGEPAS